MDDKKGFKWDGKTRVSNDTYRKNFNKIFKVNDLPKLKQDVVKSITQTSLNKKYGDLVENIIERKLKEKKDPFKKEQDELKESYEQSKRSKKEREKLLKEIADRNGF